MRSPIEIVLSRVRVLELRGRQAHKPRNDDPDTASRQPLGIGGHGCSHQCHPCHRPRALGPTKRTCRSGLVRVVYHRNEMATFPRIAFPASESLG